MMEKIPEVFGKFQRKDTFDNFDKENRPLLSVIILFPECNFFDHYRKFKALSDKWNGT